MKKSIETSSLIAHSGKKTYRIGYCLPQLKTSKTNDSSFLQQMLIANGLRARGHDISFIAPSNLTDVFCTTNVDEPVLVNRTWSNTYWFKITSKLVWHFQKLIGIPYLNFFSNLRLFDGCMQCLPGHHIVQERLGLYKMGVAMACKKLKLPYIVFFDADDILEHDLFGKPITGILRWRAKQIVQYNLNASGRIICVSEFAKAHLIAVWQVPEKKIVVFPNAADLSHFCPSAEAREEIRNRFGIGNDPLIIFVGSFFPYQDLIVLLNAFSETLVEYPKAHLMMVGEGEQYLQTTQYAKDLNISQFVHFVGFKPHSEIPNFLAAADIAVAPYHKIKENVFLVSPMKLFEYMACGVAIVASNNGQIHEVIQDGVNGLLVPPEDGQALAIALKKLIGDPLLRMQLGQQARIDTIEKHSWDRYIVQLEQVYQTLTNC